MKTDGMRYIDGEMSGADRSAFEAHMAGCDACRREMRELGALERLTGMLTIRDPMDDFRETYWKGILRRIERRAGWLLLVLGAAMIVGRELLLAARSFERVTFGNLAAGALIAGGVLLLVSVIRERVHQHRSDRYRDVIR